MTQLVLGSFIHKGSDFIGPRKTEVPTYLQSYASAFVAGINYFLFAHFSPYFKQ